METIFEFEFDGAISTEIHLMVRYWPFRVVPVKKRDCWLEGRTLCIPVEDDQLGRRVERITADSVPTWWEPSRYIPAVRAGRYHALA
jgi:hypothetical protein